MKLYKFKDGKCCHSEKEARDYQKITRCELSHIKDSSSDEALWKETLDKISNRPMQNSYFYKV